MKDYDTHITIRLIGGKLHDEIRVLDRHLVRDGSLVDMIDAEQGQAGFSRTLEIQNVDDAMGEAYVVRVLNKDVHDRMRYVLVAYGLDDQELNQLLRAI